MRYKVDRVRDHQRRLGDNLSVGSAGIAGTVIAFAMTALPPGGAVVPFLPWQPIVAFGVMANLCYRIGLTFSVGLALFPALLMSIYWVARVVMAIIPG